MNNLYEHRCEAFEKRNYKVVGGKIEIFHYGSHSYGHRIQLETDKFKLTEKMNKNRNWDFLVT